MAVNPQRLLPPSKTSEAITKIASPGKLTANKTLSVIKVKVIDISKILKGSVAVDKKLLDEKKREEGEERKAEQEEKLESDLKDKSGKIPTPKNLPKLGFLEAIKRFIGNIILGYLAVRLIDQLPKLIPVVKALAKLGDFLIDTGIGLFNGLATFVDWGYKAYDATRGFLKSFGGENFAKTFDKFIGAVDTTLFLTTALATSMAIEALTGGDGYAPDDRLTRQKPRVTEGRGGQPTKPRIPGTGPKVTMGTGGAKPKIKLPRGIKARGGGLLGLVFLIPDLIQSGMLISQGRGRDGLRTLLSAVAGVGAGIGAFSATMAGAAALGITGVGLPAAIALAIAGFAASTVAGTAAYNLTDAGLKKLGLVDRDPGTGKPYAYRTGGITRGGRAMGGVRRMIGGQKQKGKYKRVVAKKPTKIEIKGRDKDPNKMLGEDLDKTTYFGPILAISAKIAAKQEPTAKDYENVGLGLNLLISKGIEEGQLKGGLVAAFANGGLVDNEFLSAAEKGSDISNWVAKTFQGEIESKVEKNLRMIRERQEMEQRKKEKDIKDPGGGAGGEFAPGSVPGGVLTMEQLVGLAKGAGFDTNEAVIMAAIAKGESGGNSNAKNFKPPDKSYGLWQINMIGNLGPARMQEFGLQREDQLFDPVTNAKAAYAIRKSQGLSAWTIYKNGAYKNYLSAAEAAKNAPSLRTSPSFGSIELGKGYGSEGSKIAGELGRFMKKKGVVPGSVHRHPEHPPYSLTSGHSSGSLHYQGRAIDLGANANEQGPVLSAVAEFNKMRGVKPVQLLHAGNEPSGHSDHVHVAYAKGGFARGLTKALLGERGVEFVLDTDTTRALEDNFPGFLKALNTANYDDAINVLRNYTDYESSSGGSEIVVIPVPISMTSSLDRKSGSLVSGSVMKSSSSISEHMYRNS